MRMVKLARQRFPALAIVVRARSRTDAYEYAEIGVPAVREVFGSALHAAARVLRSLDFSAPETERIVKRFKEYDESQIVQSAPHRHDVKALVALPEQGGATSPSCSPPRRAQRRRLTRTMPAATASAAATNAALIRSERNSTPESTPNIGVRKVSTLSGAAR